ncbi:hypothetical protein [Marinivivus vitaminiproducens]|uniref:hypothetical protein n=1 Tax=Marinivivus vitaminiproducens TaxID=3035935 RepID=UPI0027A0C264|nr:hypothetical protein P4R82_06075 [Geminicoccaceae bacterium SCSIO 64248]
MFELVLTACLIANPAKCERIQLPFAEPSGITQCMFNGQLRAAEWKREHPSYDVRKWRCGLPEA